MAQYFVRRNILSGNNVSHCRLSWSINFFFKIDQIPLGDMTKLPLLEEAVYKMFLYRMSERYLINGSAYISPFLFGYYYFYLWKMENIYYL